MVASNSPTWRFQLQPLTSCSKCTPRRYTWQVQNQKRAVVPPLGLAKIDHLGAIDRPISATYPPNPSRKSTIAEPLVSYQLFEHRFKIDHFRTTRVLKYTSKLNLKLQIFAKGNHPLQFYTPRYADNSLTNTKETWVNGSFFLKLLTSRADKYKENVSKRLTTARFF